LSSKARKLKKSAKFRHQKPILCFNVWKILLVQPNNIPDDKVRQNRLKGIKPKPSGNHKK